MEIDQPKVPERQVLTIRTSWMQQIIDYIKDKKLPEDKTEATRVVRKSKRQAIQKDSIIGSTKVRSKERGDRDSR